MKAHKTKEASSGFSIPELLIVITIIVIVAVRGTLSLIGFWRAQQPIAAVRSMAAALRDVEQRSVAQEGGKYWGVRFDVLPGRDRYVLFSVAATSTLAGYATSSETFMPSVVQFTEPASASSTVLFDKITGEMVSVSCPSPVASTTITAATNTIRIYCNGKIE